MVGFEKRAIPEKWDREIQGYYFQVDSRRRYGRDIFTWMSVWDGVEWVSLGDPFQSVAPKKQALLRSAKEVLGELISVWPGDIYSNTSTIDPMVGNVFKYGDVVYDRNRNYIQVVLGGVDDKAGTVVTCSGLVLQKDIRYAVAGDFETPDVFFTDALSALVKKENSK